MRPVRSRVCQQPRGTDVKGCAMREKIFERMEATVRKI